MLPPIMTFADRFGPLRYWMAPMAGITDVVFRTLIRELGAQVVVSELISAEGLVRGGAKTQELVIFGNEESPVGIQLFGANMDSLRVAAKIVEQKGADFVDLNLGCPVKKIVCDGGGAAWLKDPIRLGCLFEEVKRDLKIPLSIKVRTGWDEKSIFVEEIVRIAADRGVSWVAIHGRTRAQGYEGYSDWELIRRVAQESPIPIIGNGDILSVREATEKIENGYAHGVMIGRGALKNPWIFRELMGYPTSNRNFIDLINRHFELAIERKGRRRAFLSLKKFMAWYAAGSPGASQFRKLIFELEDIDKLRSVTLDFFGSVDLSSRTDDGKPFLMGGHG